IPVVRAIHERIGRDPNLVLYSSTSELVDILKQGFPVWQETSCCGNPDAGWDAVAQQIGDFLREIAGSVSFQGVLVSRMEHVRSLEAGAHKGIQHLTRLIRDRESLIQELHDSFSWRITAPVRLLADVFLRVKAKGDGSNAKK